MIKITGIQLDWVKKQNIIPEGIVVPGVGDNNELLSEIYSGNIRDENYNGNSLSFHGEIMVAMQTEELSWCLHNLYALLDSLIYIRHKASVKSYFELCENITKVLELIELGLHDGITTCHILDLSEICKELNIKLNRCGCVDDCECYKERHDGDELEFFI